MIVCHCRGTTDREVRRAVQEGASSLGEVGRHCGAATGCGGCAGTVLEILGSEQDQAVETLTLDFVAAR